ncbi:MAG: thiamine pyrophosphate-dependent enzyme [bacterium JZ-2024 1]
MSNEGAGQEEKKLWFPGHRACMGCGVALAARLVTEALGESTIIANATGCLEVFSTAYPYSSWGVPWIHSLFENAGSVASGIYLALKHQRREKEITVVAQGGDGAFADIGFGAISGAWERGHPIVYICYDNEAYMNTGIQRSGLTPFSASTRTSPAGRKSSGNPTQKKDLVALALAHQVRYVATATVAYPKDLKEKVRKAKEKKPAFLHILSPCPLGWEFPSDQTIRIARLAVQTGLFPILEYEEGRLVSVKRIGKPVPVTEYLKAQGRFAHLWDGEGKEVLLSQIEEIARKNIEKYSLVPKGK